MDNKAKLSANANKLNEQGGIQTVKMPSFRHAYSLKTGPVGGKINS